MTIKALIVCKTMIPESHQDLLTRPLFAHLKASPLGTAVFAASEDWGTAGSSDHSLAARIGRAGEELAAAAAARVSSGPVDPFADPVSFEDLLST